MAMTGVLRPGHISLRVLDLEEGINFYKNTLGLVETGRDDQGRVYFKCWDERDHHSLILREADSAGLDFFAFKVLDDATLDSIRAATADGSKVLPELVVDVVDEGGQVVARVRKTLYVRRKISASAPL